METSSGFIQEIYHTSMVFLQYHITMIPEEHRTQTHITSTCLPFCCFSSTKFKRCVQEAYIERAADELEDDNPSNALDDDIIDEEKAGGEENNDVIIQDGGDDDDDEKKDEAEKEDDRKEEKKRKKKKNKKNGAADEGVDTGIPVKPQPNKTSQQKNYITVSDD